MTDLSASLLYNHRMVEEGQRSVNERIEVILNYCKGPRVLNIGCAGAGGAPKWNNATEYWLHGKLAEQFDEVVGIDIARERIAEMKTAEYDVLVMSAEDLDEGKIGTFDCIVAGEVIEHLTNPGRFLDGAKRCLKPDGVLVISTPNPFSPMFFLMYLKNFPRSFNPEHTCWFCMQTLEELGNRYGFRLDSFQYIDSLAPEMVPSVSYRLYAGLWCLLRRYVPRHFRNTLAVRMRYGEL